MYFCSICCRAIKYPHFKRINAAVARCGGVVHFMRRYHGTGRVSSVRANGNAIYRRHNKAPRFYLVTIRIIDRQDTVE